MAVRANHASRTSPCWPIDRYQVRIDAHLFGNLFAIVLFSEIIGTQERALWHIHFELSVGIKEAVFFFDYFLFGLRIEERVLFIGFLFLGSEKRLSLFHFRL